MPFKEMKGICIEGVVEFKLALNLFISTITNFTLLLLFPGIEIKEKKMKFAKIERTHQ